VLSGVQTLPNCHARGGEFVCENRRLVCEPVTYFHIAECCFGCHVLHEMHSRYTGQCAEIISVNVNCVTASVALDFLVRNRRQ